MLLVVQIVTMYVVALGDVVVSVEGYIQFVGFQDMME